MAEARYGRRKTRVGVVVGDKMHKTVVVAVQAVKRHRLYKKMMRRDKRYKAHDEENACQVGDKVLIVETRPLSREKRWRVAEILVAAAIPEAEKVVIEEEMPEEIRELDEAAAAAAAARAEAEAKARAEAAEAAAAAEASEVAVEAPSAEAAEEVEAEQPRVEEVSEATVEETATAAAEAADETPAAAEPEAVEGEEERPGGEAEGEPASAADEEEPPPQASDEEEEKAPEP